MRLLPVALLLLALAGCHKPVYWPAELPAFLGEDAAPVETPVQAEVPNVVTLPQAIQETIVANLRVQAGLEKVRQAQADFTTESLLPNPEFYVDSIMLPFRRITPERQAGPTQMDFTVTLPIDWLVFGKRMAAMHSARLGVDVAAAQQAELIRQRVTETVIAYYDTLEANELQVLARRDLADQQSLQTLTKKQVEAGAAANIELDRMRLAVLDAGRELRKRDAALAQAKSKLRALMGRPCAGDIYLSGSLVIASMCEPPTLEEALRLAEERRPDLVALRRQIEKAEADIRKEKKHACPPLSIQPLLTYQFQRPIGFDDALTYGVYLNSTLPLFNRNQGNIAKAESAYRESLLALKASLAEVTGEVEQALIAFRDARANVGPEVHQLLDAARNVRDKTETGFRTGNQPLTDVLTEQGAYREQLRQSVASQADYWRTLHRLNAALGTKAVE